MTQNAMDVILGIHNYENGEPYYTLQRARAPKSRATKSKSTKGKSFLNAQARPTIH